MKNLLVGAGLLVALEGCAAHESLHPFVPTAPTPTADQTFAELGKLRGLPVDTPVPVESVDDATFLAAWHTLQGGGAIGSQQLSTFYGVFTLGGPEDVMGMGRKAMDDQLSGFYDHKTKKLYVRRSAALDRLTLAHEQEHALQDRFFGIPDPATLADADQALAIRALFEGEATVASVVLNASREGTVPAVALANIARATDKDDATLFRAAALHIPKDTPPLLAAEMFWPYVRGSAFIAQLAVTGGWSLVNEALRNPPRTTEQVLHVDKYLAGERAIEVASPSAPDGYALVQTGHMGELRTRFFLAECATDEEATAAARGWGGDSFAIATSGAHRALLWSTAWDDEPSAIRFQTAIAMRSQCTRTGGKPPFKMVRDGARVAFVQGMDGEPGVEAQATALLGLVGKAPPSVPPLGHVDLVTHPPVDKDFRHQSRVVDGRLESPQIGLQSDLLTDLRVKKNDVLELMAFGPGVGVSAGYFFSPPSDAGMSTVTRMFAEAYAKAHPKEVLLDGGASRVQLAWTSADERTLRVGRLDMRFILAPTCGGRMTIFLMTTSQAGTVGQMSADWWLNRVRATDGSPACTALQTLRDPLAP